MALTPFNTSGNAYTNLSRDKTELSGKSELAFNQLQGSLMVLSSVCVSVYIIVAGVFQGHIETKKSSKLNKLTILTNGKQTSRLLTRETLELLKRGLPTITPAGGD